MAITVEHPGQHAATPEQLEEAGVDLEQVIGYKNESGVATIYLFEGDDAEIAYRGDSEIEVQVEESQPEPTAGRRTRKATEAVPAGISAEGTPQA